MLKKSPFYMVLRRELDRMVSRRLYFGVCIVLPLFCIFFMSTIFGSGQMENIPIAVVDQDNTSMSREIIRQVQAQGRPRPHIVFMTAAGSPYSEETAKRLGLK